MRKLMFAAACALMVLPLAAAEAGDRHGHGVHRRADGPGLGIYFVYRQPHIDSAYAPITWYRGHRHRHHRYVESRYHRHHRHPAWSRWHRPPAPWFWHGPRPDPRRHGRFDQDHRR